jgi:hypothetical protein
MTRTTGRYNLPWEDTSQNVRSEINFSTTKAQTRLNIDAWEKDAPGRTCIWEHGDEARQRMQDYVAFDLLSLNFGQQVTWSKTLVFLDRSYMGTDQYCSTTIEGLLLKRDTNYLVNLPPLRVDSIIIIMIMDLT